MMLRILDFILSRDGKALRIFLCMGVINPLCVSVEFPTVFLKSLIPTVSRIFSPQ